MSADKSYQMTPIGNEVARYLRTKRMRLTDSSYHSYEFCLEKFVRHCEDLQPEDFEPPAGMRRLEECLETLWGASAPRTYNKNLSIIKDFFRWQVKQGRLNGDPTVLIERARSRDVYRPTYSDEQRRAILNSNQDSLRDTIALRLLLDYGLRKGALQTIQFTHFDHQRQRVTIFTKGEKVRQIPIPHAKFWTDLEQHIQNIKARPEHYLMCGRRRAGREHAADRPELPMSNHAAHDWWYRCLAKAGVVADGTTNGERMHKARYTAGQRVLDNTGNIKAVQKLLGHASIRTTGDLYTDWDINQLEATLTEVFDDEH
jgi:site-specific recombinase XerC